MISQVLDDKPTVLAVDDQATNLLSLEVVLQHQFKLIPAHSGEEAIAILRQRQDIDVVLMDVHMPVMDGFETAGEIKKMAHCHEIPIIFITAIYTEDPYIRKGYEAGGIDYFGKPFDPDILRMKLSVYASFRRRAETLKARERHVRESEELLRVGRRLSSVLENLPVGVLIADLEGRICQSTEEVSRILKVVEPTQADSYGVILGWWDVEGRLLKDPEGSLTRALRTGESSHSEPIDIRCLDGATRTILSSISPLRGLKGEIVGAVILIQDLTETRKIEEDLEDRVNRLIGVGVELEQSVGR